MSNSRHVAYPARYFALAILASWCLELPARAALLYHVRSMASVPPGAQGITPHGINSNEQVVGSCPLSGANAFLWDSVNGYQFLSGGFAAYSINSSGQIVGNGTGANAIEWTSGGGMQTLGLLSGDTYGIASGINDSGQIAGVSFSDSGPGHAVRWTNGVVQSLGTLPGLTYGGANAINNSGQVVGSLSPDGSTFAASHAFRWTSGVGVQDLGLLPGRFYSTATAINNSGQVIGISGTSAGTSAGTHAFLWTSGVGMRDLGDLPGGEDSSYATGINSSGQVVGWSGAVSQQGIGGQDAFIWTSSGGMKDLNTLLDPSSVSAGWNISNVYAINDAGQIFGFSYSGLFMLTPVPEPSALALVGCGLAITTVVGVRRRKRILKTTSLIIDNGQLTAAALNPEPPQRGRQLENKSGR